MFAVSQTILTVIIRAVAIPHVLMQQMGPLMLIN